MSLDALSSVLWKERELLETLAYKLEVEQLVLASGRTQWLAAAAREVEAVLEEIRSVELLRSVEVDALAAELGLEPNPSLREIAECSPEPWRQILLEHREAFTATATQISRLSESNRELLTAGYHAARETLLSLSEGGGTYDADGTLAPQRRSSLVDRSL